MNNEILNDGVINIDFHKGMVCLELRIEEFPKKDAAVIAEIFTKYQIAMTPKVFLETYSSMEIMLEKLIEFGIVEELNANDKRGAENSSDDKFGGKNNRKTDSREKRALSVKK